MNVISDLIYGKAVLVTTTAKTEASTNYWKYPLPLDQNYNTYSRELATYLFQFSYLVTVHNRQVNTGETPLPLNPPDFDIVIPLSAKIYLLTVNVAWFFYSSKFNTGIIVFTGTYDDLLISVDLDFLQREPTEINNYVPGMKIHGGFWSLYSQIRSELNSLLTKHLNNSSKLFITGYSLGGGISTISMYDFYHSLVEKVETMVHYSFAAPRCFNNIGAQQYNSCIPRSYRIFNGSDIIADLPLSIMGTENFTHVEEAIFFDKNLEDYYDNHLKAYLDYYHLSLIN